MTEYIKKIALTRDIKTKHGISRWLKTNITVDQEKGIITDDSNSWSPILITTNFYSLLQCLEEKARKGDPGFLGNPSADNLQTRKDTALKSIDTVRKKVERDLNFLKNSSIWVRFCDHEDWDAQTEGTQSQDIKDAIEEFGWFNELKLYGFKPAREFIEYQSRSQKENYLNEVGAHGVFITPMIYSDEVRFRDFFLKEGQQSPFKFLGPKDSDQFKNEDVALRILLVDDRIWDHGGKWDSTISECKVCPDGGECLQCGGIDTCKLRVIRKLLSGDFILDPKKKKCFSGRTYWADQVKSFCVNKIAIEEIWTRSNDGKLELKKGEQDELYKINSTLKYLSSNNEVQVVGVYDIESALALLSCCKFDIILLDYLLGERSAEDHERSYSTELFEFLGYNKESPDSIPVVEMLKEKKALFGTPEKIKEFQDIVKLNRGPLDKFWIVPMTSYNSSFISDLQSKHVQLIDHRWNISQGADPINTPWKFLYKLNEFVDLQLRLSVFWKSQLLRFIQFTGDDLKEEFRDGSKEGYCFNEFQQFMGAEYANLQKRYGAQSLIERDADGKGINYSLFARYVREEFYGDYKEYGIVTELNRLMQRFYHRAASMFDDRHGRQRLRESYERLRVFIAYNRLDIGNEPLQRALEFIWAVIDSEFEKKKIWKWLEENNK